MYRLASLASTTKALTDACHRYTEHNVKQHYTTRMKSLKRAGEPLDAPMRAPTIWDMNMDHGLLMVMCPVLKACQPHEMPVSGQDAVLCTLPKDNSTDNDTADGQHQHELTHAESEM